MNYKLLGAEAVFAYLASRNGDSDEEPEGSRSLQANSPEHLIDNPASGNGDDVE